MYILGAIVLIVIGLFVYKAIQAVLFMGECYKNTQSFIGSKLQKKHKKKKK
jgi:hypothetical protein